MDTNVVNRDIGIGMSEHYLDILHFSLDQETYGIELLEVFEVIRISNITKLPSAPAFVKGIMNLRGTVIPIFDLRERFGLPMMDYTNTTRAIIVDIAERKTGLVVDKVNQVIKVPKDSIQEMSDISSVIPHSFINGVCKDEHTDSLVIMLDIGSILSKAEIGKLEAHLDEADSSVKKEPTE
jgi:purine-binding chemotaxis protein CheW